MMMRWAALSMAVIGVCGCGASLGTIGLMRSELDDTGLKLLRPGVTGRSCRASVVGVPLSAGAPDLREAVAAMLALDREGDVIVNAEVRWEELLTGVYNRRCLEVRGDLARAVSTIRLPSPGHTGHGRQR